MTADVVDVSSIVIAVWHGLSGQKGRTVNAAAYRPTYIAYNNLVPGTVQGYAGEQGKPKRLESRTASAYGVIILLIPSPSCMESISVTCSKIAHISGFLTL